MIYRTHPAIAGALVASFSFTPALAGPPDAELRRLVADVGAAPAGVVTPYFDRRVGLDLYPAMIAVFNDPGAGPRANLHAAMDAAGLGGAEMESSSVPGWTYVRLPAGARNAGAVADAVRNLAARADLDMVSAFYTGEDGLPVIPTRDLLVAFAPGTTEAERAAALAPHGATVVERDAAGFEGVVRVRTAARTGEAAWNIALAVHEHPAVAWAQSDRIFWARRHSFPNDPLFGQQWALDQPNGEHMDALAAWGVTIGDPSVRVVVLDSGIQQNHPDLTQLPGQSFTGGGAGGGPSNACDNHGTAVAGCIAATIDNGIGIAGIAPGVFVQSGKIFNEISFFGFCLPFLESQDSWTAAGINWAGASGVRVTNSSWGGGGASQAITSAFDATRALGVVHFAAAGNDGSSTIGYPANLASVYAVAALDSNGNRAGFSTYGNGLFISAPGAAVLTTDRTGSDGYASGDYTTIDGTSFASPYAAGVAALVLSVDPSLSPDAVGDILAQTAVDKGEPGYDTGYGWGFINAGAAVQAAAGADCPADLNNDGQLNFFDISAYLDLYNDQDPAADIAEPFGVLNFFDLAAYLDLYNAGCP